MSSEADVSGTATEAESQQSSDGYRVDPDLMVVTTATKDDPSPAAGHMLAVPFAALDAGDVATCLPFLLEAGCSARDARDHDWLMDELPALPCLHIDEDVERRALHAQRQLARVGHHRLPPVDLLIAAVADRYELAVLHYDRDYDVIAGKTDLSFKSEWLVPRGTL